MIRPDKEIAASVGVRLREDLSDNDIVAIATDDSGALWSITHSGRRDRVMVPGDHREMVPASGERAAALLATMAPRFFRAGDQVPPGALFLRRRMPGGGLEFEPAGTRH